MTTSAGARRAAAVLFSVVCLASVAHAASQERPAAAPPLPHRLLVLSDIEADPDDTQSLVRLLLYANEIDVQGLVATTSTHQRTFVAPESMRRVIQAYAAVHRTLRLHDPRYPSAESLLALVKSGPPVYGMAGVGAGKDTDGSNWIIRTLEQDDERPLWVAVWGGPNTLAQALHTIASTRSPQETARLVAKLRVYTISDQDDSGAWIRRTFPDLFYIVSPGGYGDATWTAINTVVPGIDNTTISNRWLAEHIQQGHGPLGAAYPDVAYGMEGDTPSWLALIPNGLSVPERPDWGGWGGRYERYQVDVTKLDPKGFTGGVPIEPETRPIWSNAVDGYTPTVAKDHGRAHVAGTAGIRDFRVTLWRWRDDFQHDFAARMDWTMKSYADANHPPLVVLNHPAAITVRSGESFNLDARDTTDPDGDSLSFLWFEYPEAGPSTTPCTMSLATNMARVLVTAPKVDRDVTTHFILNVTDKGTPPLTRYARVIVTVRP